MGGATFPVVALNYHENWSYRNRKQQAVIFDRVFE